MTVTNLQVELEQLLGRKPITITTVDALTKILTS